MRLQDFMITDVETIASTETVQVASDKLHQHRIRHLVVMDGRTIAGVVSERDLRPFETGIQREILVQDIMTTPIVTASPDTTVREAANLMRGQTIGCLPIVERDRERDRLVGIITTTDLLELLGRGIERIVPDTERRPVSRENPGRKLASFNPKTGKK